MNGLTVFLQLLFIILAYLIGSIPFGYIIGKIKKIDIRTKGSGNIGATNVGRLLGKKYAVLTYFLDLLKGAVLVALFRYKIISPEYMVLSPMLYGMLAALGHSYSVFLNFKGGKAVSTSCGMILGYSPLVFLIILIVFLIVKSITKLVSLGSLISTFTAVICILIFAIIGKDPTMNKLYYTVDWETFVITVIAASIIFIKHADNIKRLIKGEETKSNY